MTLKDSAGRSGADAQSSRGGGGATQPHEHAASAVDPDTNELADDLLVGAIAIARFFKWKAKNGKWNARKIYSVASKGSLPIRNVAGLGLCARRSELLKFFSMSG